jgi:mono/diheme cytochrome c family protein
MKSRFRILGYAAASLLTLVVVAATTVYVSSAAKLKRKYVVMARPVAIPTDVAAIARGQHIAQTRGCVDCHGRDFGGGTVIENGAMGRVYAPNLTPGRGSDVRTFADLDWVRATRHGVARDGRGLFIMPSAEYSHFSDEDLGSVIAFLKTVPPVERDRLPSAYGPVTRVLLALGKMKIDAGTIDHPNIKPPAIAKSATVEYGRYLATGCAGCHGSNFSGGKIEIGPPDWPPARNLTPHESGDVAKWNEGDFVRAIREARRPDGTVLNPVMPRGFAGMDDEELRALWLFFRSLPPVATGLR